MRFSQLLLEINGWSFMWLFPITMHIKYTTDTLGPLITLYLIGGWLLRFCWQKIIFNLPVFLFIRMKLKKLLCYHLVTTEPTRLCFSENIDTNPAVINILEVGELVYVLLMKGDDGWHTVSMNLKKLSKLHGHKYDCS